ncbi:MAG: PDZ domain-containing protein [Planctomycetota bacterium]
MNISLKHLGMKIRAVILLLALMLIVVELFCMADLQYTEPSLADQKLLEKLVKPNLTVNPHLMPSNLPHKIIEMPLQKLIGKYFFTAQLNGIETNVMVDYGGGTTLGLTPDMVLKTKATLSDKTILSSSIVITSLSRTGLMNTMTIDNTTLCDIPFVMGPTNIQFVESGITLFRGEAMVGLPFLAGFKQFVIDRVHNKLVLGKIPEELLKQEHSIRLPIDYRNEALHIQCYINETVYDFIVDIGGNATDIVTLYGNTAKTFMKTHPYEETGQATGFGERMVKTYQSKVSIIKTGTYEIRNISIGLVPDSPIEGGTIGNPFFGETIIGVDLDQKTLYFLDQPKLAQPKLGVSVRPIDKSLAFEYGFDSIEELLKELKIDKAEGLFVAEVIPGSSANKAGILKGDIILEYNNQKVNSANQLIDFIRKSGVDKKVTLKIIRDGEEKSIQVTIGQ